MSLSSDLLPHYCSPPYGRTYCTIPTVWPLTAEEQMAALKGAKKRVSKVNTVYDLLRQEN